MLTTIKPSSFIKDIIFTSVTFLAALASFIVVTRLLAEGLGPERFGAYALARNIVSTAISLAGVAMAVAIPRYIAIAKDESQKNSYLLSGLILITVSCSLVLICGLIFKNQLTALIFRNEAYSTLFVASLIMIVGYSLYGVLYGFYRGIGRMDKANIWHLSIMAIGNAVIAFLFYKSGKVGLIVSLMGMIAFTAVIPLVFYSYKAILEDRRHLKIWADLKELFQYGFPRVPGGIALAGIMTAGPFLASYFMSLADAGYITVGQSIFRIIEGGLGVFGLVALPRVAQFFADGKNEFLGDRINDVLSFIFHIGLFITLHLALWIDSIISIWLGGQFEAAILPARICILALIPYFIYSMLSPIIDAIEKRAVNTYNIFISFAIVLAVSLISIKAGLGIFGLALGIATGYLSLGALTASHIFGVYRFNSKVLEIRKCLLLNLVFIIIAVGMKRWLELTYHSIDLIVMAFIAEGSIFLVYGLLLWKTNVGWMVELKNRF